MMNAIFKQVIRRLSWFSCVYDNGDRLWRLYLPIQGRWQYIFIKEYEGIYYLSGSDFDFISSNAPLPESEKEAALLKALPDALEKLAGALKRDSLGYYYTMNRSIPPSLRTGVIPRKITRELIPDFLRFDLDLSKNETGGVIQYLRAGHEQSLSTMTAAKFFSYCRTAYLANPGTHQGLDKNASGRELYLRWADGRTGGIEDLPPQSKEAFEKWFDGKTWQGCHPWEIYRGGNSTHIDLAVTRSHPGQGWKIFLSGFASTRLVEVCRITLALDRAGQRFELQDRESYLARLTGNDWVGIIPECDGIKYAYQEFPDRWHVADCIKFSWFKDESGRSLLPMRRIRQLVTWFPLPAPSLL